MTTSKGTWITNHPGDIKGFWPRRACYYEAGDPKATDQFTVAELKEQGLIGIYLAEDLDTDYYSLPKLDAHEYLVWLAED